MRLRDEGRRLSEAADGPEDRPYEGRIVGGAHRFAVRAYFEDTDFSGVVYHASYLRWMERARSDMLARAGIDQRAAHEAGEGVYAVAELHLRYRAPARFDDALLIVSRVVDLGAASVTIAQAITREDRGAPTAIADATVRAAFLSPSGRPKRQPAAWTAAYRAVMGGAP